MALIYFLLSFLVVKVYPHGQMSSPRLRGCTQVYNKGLINEYCSEYGNFGPQGVAGEPDRVSPSRFDDYIVCRNVPREDPYVTVEAGKKLKLDYLIQAPHPGDCALYVSYDDDSEPDGQKQFALIWQKKDCLCYVENGKCSWFPDANAGTCPNGCPQRRVLEATIPAWLPAGRAVFHHNWYATHPRTSGAVAGYPTVELYTGCFDANVVNNNPSYRPNGITNLVKIPEVLPKLPIDYRGNNAAGNASFGTMASYKMATKEPTKKPTKKPTKQPTKKPTAKPTKKRTANPTKKPTNNPNNPRTKSPTRSPTKKPTTKTTKKPTKSPTKKPTTKTTKKPTTKTTKKPTKKPTKNPTKKPTKEGETRSPTKKPTRKTTANPTKEGETRSPTKKPTLSPTKEGETRSPTRRPTVRKIINGTQTPTQTQTQTPTFFAIDPSSGKSVQPYVYLFISMVLLHVWSLNL